MIEIIKNVIRTYLCGLEIKLWEVTGSNSTLANPSLHLRPEASVSSKSSSL